MINSKMDIKYLHEIRETLDLYLLSCDKNIHNKYYFNLYYPYIKMNDNSYDIIRFSINRYNRSHTKIIDLSVDEIALLNKIFPIYYHTYDIEFSVFDVYKDQLIKMMTNKIRKDKLNKLKNEKSI